MFRWALIFLVIGLVMAILGFGGIGGAFVGIAKILFYIAVAIFLIFLILHLVGARRV